MAALQNVINFLNEYAQLVNLVLFGVILGFLFRISSLYHTAMKEQINLLERQLGMAEAEAPLAVAESLEKRVQLTENEIKRLEIDREKQAKETKGIIELMVEQIGEEPVIKILGEERMMEVLGEERMMEIIGQERTIEVAASDAIALLRNEPSEPQPREEVPLEIFILYQSTLDRLSTTLHHTWSWELIFNIVIYVFSNHPNEQLAKHFPEDPLAYKVLDLNSENWMSPPAKAGELRTDRVAFIHNSELGKFSELEEGSEGDSEGSLQAKALAKFIKFAGRGS